MIFAILLLIFTSYIQSPTASSSNSDTIYKQEIGALISELEEYAGNHNGAYPTADTAGWAAFMSSRTGGDTSTIKYKSPQFGPGDTKAGDLRYGLPAECANDKLVTSTKPRQLALQVGLSDGGTYCAGNY